jgi:hypothetical protein
VLTEAFEASSFLSNKVVPVNWFEFFTQADVNLVSGSLVVCWAHYEVLLHVTRRDLCIKGVDDRLETYGGDIEALGALVFDL